MLKQRVKIGDVMQDHMLQQVILISSDRYGQLFFDFSKLLKEISD